MVLEMLNLYDVFVRNIFGGILLSGIGIAVILTIIGIMGRMSTILLIFILALFIMAFGIGYVGALVAIPVFIIAMFWFGIAFMNWLAQTKIYS